MSKKIIGIFLSVVLLLSMVACGGSKDPEGDKGKDTSSGGIVEGDFSGSEYLKKDYNGAYFRFLYWYEPSEYARRKVAAFNKKFNANIEIVVTSEGLDNELAKSVASGMPYDIVAMHGNYYPSLINSDLLEPLDTYISDADMCDTSAPEKGGLSSDVLQTFNWKGKTYAAGSAKSIYSNMFMYNKLMFSKAGLEDPWKLYQDGKWTWDKFTEMAYATSDIANEICFFERPELSVWLNINGIEFISRDGDNFKENLTNADLIAATQSYKELFLGQNPISRTVGGGGVDFLAGRAYCFLSQTDGYTMFAQRAATSSAFARDSANLGCVPIPVMPYNKTGKYPGHAPQGYAAGKGSSDPSIAVAFAVFESTLSDSDIGSKLQMPAEVRNAIDTAFAKGGFISYCGFKNSSGDTAVKALSEAEKAIIAGGDAVAALNSARNVVTRAISDSVS